MGDVGESESRSADEFHQAVDAFGGVAVPGGHALAGDGLGESLDLRDRSADGGAEGENASRTAAIRG